MMEDDHDATGLAALVAAGEVTPDELLDAALARAEAAGELNAVVGVYEDVARAAIAAGLPDGPFRGVPFLLKDLGAEATDLPASSGSRLFAGATYPADSAIVARIRAAGTVPFGRTASPELGIGAATEAAIYGGPTRNPWDLDRTPGGSSGGSGAAVAAGVVPAAHGSDGGGSVRIPASSCGLFGFKPTRARLPDGPYAGEGWAGMAIDGFLSRSVRDTAGLLDACAGPDRGAPYAAPPLAGTFAAARPPERLRVALCSTTLTGEPIHPHCRAAAEDTAALLELMGHHVEEARPEADTAAMMEAWTLIVAAGTAASVRGRLATLGRDLEPGDVENVVRDACRVAEGVSGADYVDALATIHAYGRQMALFFERHDVLVTATLAEPPAPIGRFDHSRESYRDYRLGPDGVFAYSPFCAAFNASGQPAVSVPLHWADGLPIGVHLAMPFGDDLALMGLCFALEEARPWFHRRPPFTVNAREAA